MEFWIQITHSFCKLDRFRSNEIKHLQLWNGVAFNKDCLNQRYSIWLQNNKEAIGLTTLCIKCRYV